MPPPSGKRGRQYRFGDAAIQTCLVLKVRPVCHCGK
ncbi:transposase [Epibacterium mobile]|nr:transposase [Tritonibacter mobilis]